MMFPRLKLVLATIGCWYWATHDPFVWSFFFIALLATVAMFLWDNRDLIWGAR